jgi:hypothetical protein
MLMPMRLGVITPISGAIAGRVLLISRIRCIIGHSVQTNTIKQGRTVFMRSPESS